jgi:hypothetical protein
LVALEQKLPLGAGSKVDGFAANSVSDRGTAARTAVQQNLPYWPILPSTKDIPILKQEQSGSKRKRLQIFNILSKDCCKMTPRPKKYL